MAIALTDFEAFCGFVDISTYMKTTCLLTIHNKENLAEIVTNSLVNNLSELNDQIIVVFDGCTDNSENIVKSILDIAIASIIFVADCKFPKEVGKIKLFEAIEILDCTEKARLSIKSVPEWSA